ncbi:MAG TPA: ATP-binding protein, partial [Rhodocyclaceae bacterium]|nr:ATP-binding protein [Rhodocyclaceae bacterium]
AGSSSRTYWAVLGAALLGVAGAAILIVASLVQERANRIAAATEQADNTSRLVASYVLQTIQKADMVLRDVQEHVQPADMRARRGENPQRTEELHRLLARKLAAVPEGSIMHLSNAAGDHIYSSLAEVPDINIGDRYHFLRQRDDPAAGLVISPPLVSRTTGKWAFVATRRLNFEDGSFAGIINLIVNLDGLEKFFASVDVMPHGVVNMRDREMRLMARFPAAPEAMGQVVADHPALPYIRQGLDHAIYRAPGSVDQVDRLYSFRSVGDLGLFVFVGLSDEDYLADWRVHLRVYGLAGLLLAATVLLLLYMAWRGLRDQAATLAALAGEEEKFHTVADYTYDWEYWQGADQEILFMSPSCERVTGYRRDEFLADSDLLYRVIHPDDRHLMADHLRDAAFAEEGTLDFRIVRKDGEVRWIAHGCRAVFGENGEFKGRRASNHDITERRRAEAIVRELNAKLEDRVAERTAELEAANKELEEFSYSMSHDMRAPLRAIDGFSKILLDEQSDRLDEEGRQLQLEVRRNAQRMGQLIDDILHFLKMRRRQMTAGTIDMAALVTETFEHLRATTAAGRPVHFGLRAMPPAWGDREMIRQVLRNLVSNAVKFAAPSRDALVEVGGTADAGENVYYVKDNGIGFDMRFADKLFKVFERVHPTGQYEGSAIGLAIVKRIVGRHGGRVWAEGKVGEGATFYFSLPSRQP